MSLLVGCAPGSCYWMSLSWIEVISHLFTAVRGALDIEMEAVIGEDIRILGKVLLGGRSFALKVVQSR